jgi:hypothetical protein
MKDIKIAGNQNIFKALYVDIKQIYPIRKV